MYNRTSRLAAAAFAMMTAFTLSAHAQEPSRDTVLATVNGTNITLGHVIALRATLGAQYSQYPDETLYNGILDQMIQQTLLMQSLEVGPSLLSQLSIENENRAILSDQALRQASSAYVSEGDLIAAYNETYDDPQTEYRASHILVETEEEAEALVAELDGGADFATLAREKSTGPSGPGGGDLGWFAEGMMVQSFYDAVTKLKKGEVSQPVETRFGWHVILLTDQRVIDTPPFEEVRGQIEEELRNQVLDDFVKRLETSATISRAGADTVDPALIKRFDLLEN